MAAKILTVGSALGSFSSLFSKVKAIDAKHGRFELLLCTGDFFRSPSEEGDDLELDLLLQGKLDVPISTYIMQGLSPIPSKVLAKTSQNGGEVCPNVFLLGSRWSLAPISNGSSNTSTEFEGKTSIVTTSQRLTIASFGGCYDPDTFRAGKGVEAFDLSSPSFNSTNLASFLSSPSLPSIAASAEPSLATVKTSTSTSQIDILLTNGWPSSITRLSKTSPPTREGNWAAPPLDDVVKACRPRYHFAAAGGSPPIFWEREPFIWEAGQVTRFVGLGAFGDPIGVPAAGKKPRWFYALSIAPLTTSSPPLPRPTNATSCPFPMISTRGEKRAIDNEDDTGVNFIFGDVQIKKPRLDQGAPYARRNAKQQKPTAHPPEGYVCRRCQSTEHYIGDCPERNATGDTGGKKPPPGYVCRACASDGHFIQDCPDVKERPRPGPVKEISPDECWFCLSNPRLTKHLIVSIGSEVYVTLPKGQLPPTDDMSSSPTSVPGGGHLLIIPISHYPTFSSIPPDLAQPILSELDTYKNALRTLYAVHGAVPVFFEVSRLTGKGGHAHVQVVPVPEAKQDGVEAAFRAYGGQQVVWEEDPLKALTDAAGGKMNYFRVDLPDGRKMVHIIRPGKMFNLQFGREALGNFLELSGRVDWKRCSQTEEEERRDALAFKNVFLEYDPSLL